MGRSRSRSRGRGRSWSRSVSVTRGARQGRRCSRSRSRSRGNKGGSREVVWSTYLTPHGIPYYVQAESNQTTWERPQGARDRVLPPPQMGMMGPTGPFGHQPQSQQQQQQQGSGSSSGRTTSWYKCVTPTGVPYYFSQELQQSVWQAPNGPNDRIVGEFGPPPMPPQMPGHPMMMGNPMMMMGGHPMAMPGMPGHGMVPPVSDEAIESFVSKSGLDNSATRTLRGLAPEVLRQIIDRGALTEARNPQAVLNARIRDAERGLENARNMQNGGYQHIPGIMPGELEAFIMESRLDAIAAGKLRGLPPEVLKKVMERGALTDARNPNAVLMGRIRDAEHDVRGRDRDRGTRNRGRSNSRSCSRSRSRSYSPGRGGMERDKVEAFIEHNGIDNSAGDKLRRLASHLQQRVMERGSLRDARNPNAVLIGRIRDAEQEANTDRGRGGGGGGDSIEVFVSDNRLDNSAAEKLRALPKDILARVIARGSLTDARNPNAVLMGRIRDAEQDLHAPRHGRSSAAVEAFIVENNLDASAADKLRSLPEDMQHTVIDRGNLADARNPNAMLMRRIKDAEAARR